MLRKWLEKRKQKRNREIALAVANELSANQSWEKFLPPVVMRDCVYMVTESGTVYRMQNDGPGDMEMITKIAQI